MIENVSTQTDALVVVSLTWLGVNPTCVILHTDVTCNNQKTLIKVKEKRELQWKCTNIKQTNKMKQNLKIYLRKNKKNCLVFFQDIYKTKWIKIK